MSRQIDTVEVYSVFYARVTHSSVDEQDVMKEYYQDVLMQKSYQIREAYDYDTWGEFEDYLRGWQQPEVKIYPYEGRASLKAWLSIIASNFSLDSKKSKRELTQMLIERQTIIDENTFSTFGMGNKDDEEKEAETRRDVEEKKKKEVRQYIINHINGINEPLDKLILKQYYFIKAKQQDIANEIGVDTATVSRRLTNIVLRIYEEAVEHFSNKYMVQPIPPKPKKNEENKKLKEEYKKYMERIKCIIKEYLNIHGEKIIV